MRVINQGRGYLPIKVWLDTDLEEKTLEQAINLASHQLVKRHVALMPDCHSGFGMPIGGVIACENGVIPNAVGVDIGCGMLAMKFNTKKQYSKKKFEKIIEKLKREIPVGFEHRKEVSNDIIFDNLCDGRTNEILVRQNLLLTTDIDSIWKQLGTLGGGNHFIEIQRDEEDYIWIMIHSGSRNIGHKIASFYNKKAIELCNRWHTYLPSKDLAFLPVGEKEFAYYISSMKYALDFAKENRAVMCRIATTIICDILQCKLLPDTQINIHHNYANLENHFGRNYWIHRKGATSAAKDQFGIIPGSMGTHSYIVRGLGNPDSFSSCSHGAGRRMGRMEFCRKTTLDDANKSIKGLVFSGWGEDRKGRTDFSEAPKAYKDIDMVMENQKDLVKVVHKLKPIAVLKG